MAQYTRICNFCHKEFIAQKANTKFCSQICTKRGYKLKKRLEHAQLFDDNTTIKRLLYRILTSVEEMETLLQATKTNKAIHQEQLLTTQQYCKLEGIHRKTLDRMIQRNEVAIIKEGKRIFIDRSQLKIVPKADQ